MDADIWENYVYVIGERQRSVVVMDISCCGTRKHGGSG